jgi:hypothetical protein
MTTLALLSLLLPALAHAAAKAGVTLPDTMNAGGKALQLNGLGVREATVMNIDVYVAGLYLENRSPDPAAILDSSQVKRLELVFVRDVDREDIVDAWKDGFKKNGADMAVFGPRIGTLNAWMSDIKEKDTLVFLIEPGKGLTVTNRGRVKGTIPGDDFARAFLSIWLGPSPPNKGLKAGLLGK